MGTIVVKSRFQNLLLSILPKNHWYHAHIDFRRKALARTFEIESFENMSKKLQETVESNHFANHLLYESLEVRESNVDSQ